MVRADDALADLERALTAAPRDESLLAVYADALAERGDPRGEILALEQHLGELDASAAETARRRIAAITREVIGEGSRKAVRLVHGFIELEIDGGESFEAALRVLQSPAGIWLRRLRIRDRAAEVVAVLASAPWPNLVEIALALPEIRDLDPAFTPALRSLDLSHRPLHGTILDALAEAPLAAQLERIVLPSLARADDALRLNRLLATLPVLRAIDVPLVYTEHAQLLAHPTARITVASLAAWRDPASIGSEELLAIEIPGMWFTGHVEMQGLAALLAASPPLAPAALDAWRLFWALLEGLRHPGTGHGQRVPFPAEVLVHAIDALDQEELARIRGWSALRHGIGPNAHRRMALYVSMFRAPRPTSP